MLKKQAMILFASLILSCFMAGTALAKEITIINGTSFQIHALAISDSASDQWGDDLLGQGILQPNEGIIISLSGSLAGWDMAVMDYNGDSLEFHHLDFTQYSRVTLHSDGTAYFE